MYDSPNPIDDPTDPRYRPQMPAPPQPGPATAPPPPPPPSGTFNRDQFRDTLMSSVRNPTDLANFVNAHQSDYGAGVQLLPGGKGDKIVLPDGSVIDAVIGAGAGGLGAGWTGAGTLQNGVYTAPPPAAGVPGGIGSGGAGGSDFQNQIRSQLLAILQSSQKPVDANDRQIAAQMNAAQRLSDRQVAQQRAAAAERAAANGLLNGGQSSGGFDTEVQGINEDAAQGLQGLQASLFGRVAQQKQAQLQQALQLAVQSGDAEAARAIQVQLAQMDAQLRSQQLAQQASQWNDQFGLQGAQFQYLKDRDLANAGLGG